MATRTVRNNSVPTQNAKSNTLLRNYAQPRAWRGLPRACAVDGVAERPAQFSLTVRGKREEEESGMAKACGHYVFI
eukprot:6720950-Pyramimonas_sp.AAC.1